MTFEAYPFYDIKSYQHCIHVTVLDTVHSIPVIPNQC